MPLQELVAREAREARSALAGLTTRGRCLLAIISVNHRIVVSVVLGTPSQGGRDTDTLALLDYGFRQYRRVAPLARGRAVAEAKVAFFGDRKVAVQPSLTRSSV